MRIRRPRGAERAARFLLDAGAEAVLVKSGGRGGAAHLLVTATAVRLVPAGPRRAITSHGGGCTLAAAIAGRLAAGRPVEEAIAHAQRLVRLFFERAVRRGGPWGPDPLGAWVGVNGLDSR